MAGDNEYKPDWLGFAGGAIGSALSLASLPYQTELQKDLMHESEAINIAQWNRENEYNSPKNQMARLKAAGLNPDLAIGGSPTNTSGSSSPLSGTPSAPNAPEAVGNAIQSFYQSRLVSAQVKKEEAAADLATEQANELRSEAPRKNERFIWERVTNRLKDELLTSQRETQDNKTVTERQRGLGLALYNWSNGYRPLEYDNNGHKSYDEQDFGIEFYQQLDDAHNIIKDVALEYDLSSYDKQYLDRCFEDMVQGDLESFRYHATQLRNRTRIEEFKDDNKWFMFLDYFTDKLLGYANGAAGAYMRFSAGRNSGSRARVNRAALDVGSD